MKIVIIGAGIGGLATALSLGRAGFDDVTVVERAAELRPLGVGINLLPHAVRELTELGLGDRVTAIGTAPGRLAYFNRFGQPVWSEPRGLEAGYRWPQLSVHRGEFQLLLVEAVRERFGDEAIRLGWRATGVEHGVEVAAAGGGIRAQERVSFADAAGDELVLDADVVVAADGIHSAIRAQHNPGEGAPPWNRLVLWRGTAVVPAYLDGRTMIMAGDAEQKFVAYPLVHEGAADEGAEGAADGTIRVNFIAERRAPEGVDETADWNHAVDPAPIVELFADWRFDWLDVPGVIAAADEILEYPMVDRDPLERWTVGCTTLLGDAAHALYPNGSNGASQAVIDARTLAFHLAGAVGAAAGAGGADATGRAAIETALAAYEADRRPATTRLNEMTRRLGPERVMQLAFERAPQGFADVHDVIPEAELRQIADSYKVAAGFHPDLLNERSSLTPAVRA
ncbi:2-polyprenyl-6-methoxyphenol hydroxylase [Agromyces sp. CF514]|uniref:FAD-dependent monooxygenase n=1 Tax=Agromyces sp. CF514 TaxID=1881031 RepID=UPI0008DF1C92|nr:FAD-dependent monooxygenase [Agromyces sp. CF514]SFR70595.1 2-polyprenyl-6-methoxyphenol hydroxylase [Agromyces sp. CF514]